MIGRKSSLTTTGLLLGSLLLLPRIPSASPSEEAFTSEQRSYWAFQKVIRPEVPAVTQQRWIRNAIDAFVLARLEADGVSVSPPADRITLLRRASFDLIGLPPTTEEVAAFLSNDSPRAFQKVIDRFLGSPHYGERWGRHWLDVARYADSEGFKLDLTRPNAWRYRDYVIEAFNRDRPYDEFIREQIAGDEFRPDDSEARIATAFNRHYPDETQINILLRRQEILNDITDTVGAAFLGLTVGCARCHDHKYDPILQADYYRLQAFFANIRSDDEIALWSDERIREHRRKQGGWKEATRSIREEIEAILAPVRKTNFENQVDKFPENVQTAFLKPDSERTTLERWLWHKEQWRLNPNEQRLANMLKGENKERYEELKAELNRHEDLYVPDPPVGTGIREMGNDPPTTHVLKGGVLRAELEQVQPGFLAILQQEPVAIEPSPDGKSSGRRTALAHWLSSSENPLTARVMVNRIWAYHFGRGIVGTPSDFGAMGDPRSHPQLLDWLAAEFVRSGWSIKQIHRLIMESNTYQQASIYRAAANRADPFNSLQWRFAPRRLEAEVIRDTSLAVAGLLNRDAGGPSVFPDLPENAPVPTGGWEVSEDRADHHRRSIYVFVRRNSQYPMLEVFDMPDTLASCARRITSTTAPQALTLLNSKLTLAWAQAFAGRVIRLAGEDVDAQIDSAYRLAYSHSPSADARDLALSFFHRHREIVAERASGHEKLALPQPMPAGFSPADGAALVDFCHMLMSSSEFFYLN